MSSRKQWSYASFPQAIQYCEENIRTKEKRVQGPLTYEVFEKRYRSKDWPLVNYRTEIWNGCEIKHWTPIFKLVELFKRLDPKTYKRLRRLKKLHPEAPSPPKTQNGRSYANKRTFASSTPASSLSPWNHKLHHKSISNSSSKEQEKPMHRMVAVKQMLTTGVKNHCKCNCKTFQQHQQHPHSHRCDLKAIYDKYHTQTAHLCYCLHCCNWSRASFELFKWLVISRAFIFILGIGLPRLLNSSPFDASTDIGNVHILAKPGVSWLDTFVLRYLSPFSNWDGQFFVHIAQFGYEHEKMFAFLPGLPLILNSIIPCVRKLVPGVHFKSLAVLCGVIWNAFISTYLSALILYYLTVKIYHNPRIALIASKLFLINPASVFFCAVYTESTFAFVSFLLMLCCELKYFDCNNRMHALSIARQQRTLNRIHSMMLSLAIVLCIAIACSLRSNGVILVGFPLYYSAYTNWFAANGVSNALSFIRAKCQQLWLYVSSSSSSSFSSLTMDMMMTPTMTPHAATIANYFCSFMFECCLLLAALSPWLYYHHWSRSRLCTATDILTANRPYCHSSRSTVYSYVQSAYWECGFLARWNTNEIGNFALAMPIWFICYHAMRHYKQQFLAIANVSQQQPQSHTEHAILLRHKQLPYVLYWFVLWLILIFYAHVQISTRFICCSCPALYWFCAEIIYDQSNQIQPVHRNPMKYQSVFDQYLDIATRRPSPTLIIAYFLLYFSIGTIAFCTFLPFV